MDTGVETMVRRYFHEHETDGVDELDGMPLAGFGQRALGYLIDLFLVVQLWVPLEMLWARYVSHEWTAHGN
jgi:hypothetical protein